MAELVLRAPRETKSLRWVTDDDGERCELWTGKRWIDVEVLLERLAELEGTRDG